MTLLSLDRRRIALIASLSRRRFSRATLLSLSTAAIWQVANYAIPLVTFPYLARVLGVHGFGVLAIATAISSYALLVTDWGFNLTATQAVARAQADPAAVNSIVWSTVVAKGILGCGSSAVVLVATDLFMADAAMRAVIPFALLNVVASVFTIDWALRGVGNIRAFVTASIIGRMVSIPATFILVRHADDVALATLSGALASICTAALSLVLGARLGFVRAPALSVRTSLAQIGEGVHVFTSMAAASLYTSCLALVLGWTSGPAAAGLFSAADRIRRPVQALLSPIELVFYPRLSALAAADPSSARALSLKILGVQSAIALSLSLGLFVTAPQAVRLVLGPGFEGAAPVLRVLAANVFVIGVNNVLGLMILLPFGLRRQFSLCTLAGALAGLAMAFPLSAAWGAWGMAWVAVAAEVVVVLAEVLAARPVLFGEAARRR